MSESNVMNITVEIETLDDGYVVGIPGLPIKRRLATSPAQIAGKVGLLVADAIATIEAAMAKATVRDPTPAPAPVSAPVVASPAAPVAIEPTPSPAPPTPEADLEPEPEEASEPEAEPEAEPVKSLNDTDSKALDALIAALGDGRVESSTDPDDPGFYSSALVAAGVFDTPAKASAFLSRAFAANEVGRGARTKEGFRYFVRRPVPVRPPAPPPTPAPAQQQQAAPASVEHAAPPAAPRPPFPPRPAAPTAAPAPLPF